MNGLLKNKILCMEGSLKISIALSIVFTFLGLFYIDYKLDFQSQEAISIVVMVTTSCSFIFLPISYSIKEKDLASQWEKFSLTLPVTRKNIVNAEFISQWFITVIVFLYALCSMGIFEIIGISIGLEYSTRILSLIFTVLVVTQALVYLIGLKMGSDHLDVYLIVALFLSIGLYFLPTTIIPIIFPELLLTNFEYRIIICIVSLAIFGICYAISQKLIEKKEF